MWSSESEKGPPVAQKHSLRDLEQHLGDLKKENFSLKLRIYFLEERVQQGAPLEEQDLSRQNIELNVQLQSLKKELEEKEQLLQETVSTAGLVSNQSAEQQHRHETTNQLQDTLEAKIQQLQQELSEQEQVLQQKDRFISDLTTEKLSLEQKVQELSSAPRKRPRPQQEVDGDVCEETTERCLTELHRAQNQVHTLQMKIRISEDRNKLLQKRLGEMELELRDVREEAQNQEGNLQHLQETLISKDQEVVDLHRVLEEQNRALCSLKEAALRQLSSSPACGVSELQMLLQQKNAVDRELHELKTQLHRTGFSSLSQIRKALSELKTQNQDLKQQLSQPQQVRSQRQEQGAETEPGQWEGWDSQLAFDHAQAASQTDEDSPLHRGGAVDLGYETCERSETEAERDTSSPEFDDLELCLSLDHGSHWWTPQTKDSAPHRQVQEPHPEDSAPHRQVQELQKLVHHLKTELNLSQTQVHRLQNEGGARPEGGARAEPDDLADLLSRVESLENQLKTESKAEGGESASSASSGVLSLVHLQARELSRLRQVLRESRGLVQILVQVQTEQLKGLEALLVSGEPDYGLGQRLREELREGHELLLRLSQKISLKDLPEDPDDKTELLAMRLSKELQQKDLLIESLRSKLRPDTPTDSTDQSDRISYVSDGQLSNQDEDLESHGELQDQSQSGEQTAGQSERSVPYSGQSQRSIPYSSQSQRSIPYGSQSERSAHYGGQSMPFYSPADPLSGFSSVPLSVASAHSFPTMHCSPGYAPSAALLSALKPSLSAPPPPAPPHAPAPPAPDRAPPAPVRAPPAPVRAPPAPVRAPPAPVRAPPAPVRAPPAPVRAPPAPVRAPPAPVRAPPAPVRAPPGPVRAPLGSALNPCPGFSLAEVHQELQTLQKQLQNSHSGAALRPLPPRPIAALSAPGFSSASLDSALRPWNTPLSRPIAEQHSAAAYSCHSLPGPAHLPGATTLLPGPAHPGATLLPASALLPGPALLAEHLAEGRSLRLRLEESIQTNERLRAQLETRLDPPTVTAPTNIYIQGAASSESRLLRETSFSLQERLRDSLLEAERLRETLLLVQTRLKEAELQAQRWAELSRSSQSEASAQRQEVMALRQEQQGRLEVIHRLELEVSALQQQLRDQSERSEAAIHQSERSEGSQSERSAAEGGAWRRLQFSDCPSVRDTRPDPDHKNHQDQDQKNHQDPDQKSHQDQDQKNHQDQDQESRQVQLLQSELASLRQKLSEREQSLRETTEKVQENSRSSQTLELLVLSQLSRTRDVLRKAKTNLQTTHAAAVTVS